MIFMFTLYKIFLRFVFLYFLNDKLSLLLITSCYTLVCLVMEKNDSLPEDKCMLNQ